MKHKIGIVQGRLLKSPKNRLQYFPVNIYEKEFAIAKEIGFDFIEFFSQRKFSKKNPIWSENGINHYKKLCQENDLQVLNFCDDYIISNDLRKLKTIDYLINLLHNCSKLKIKNLILPMYGKSNLSESNYLSYVKAFNTISKDAKLKKINILVESNISVEFFKSLKKIIHNKNIFFLYDTGNRLSPQPDYLKEIIKFSSEIRHIHIKDKNFSKKNVILGEGNVDFNKIFNLLKKIKYKGNFTLETNKGKDPINVAKKNMYFVEKLIKKIKFQ